MKESKFLTFLIISFIVVVNCQEMCENNNEDTCLNYDYIESLNLTYDKYSFGMKSYHDVLRKSLFESFNFSYFKKTKGTSNFQNENKNNEKEGLFDKEIIAYNKHNIINYYIPESSRYPLFTNNRRILNLKRMMTFDNELFSSFDKGNFNHFSKICYINQYPLFFTTDNILESTILNIHEIIDNVHFQLLIPAYREFLSLIIKEIKFAKDKIDCKNCTVKHKLNQIEVYILLANNIVNSYCGFREQHLSSNDNFNDYMTIQTKIKEAKSMNLMIMGKERYLEVKDLVHNNKDKSGKDCINGFKKSLAWIDTVKLSIDEDDEVYYIWVLAKLMENSSAWPYYKTVYNYFVKQHGYMYTRGDYQYIYELVFEQTGISDYELDYIQIEKIRSIIEDSPKRQKIDDFFYEYAEEDITMPKKEKRDNISKEYFKKIPLFELNESKLDFLNIAVSYLSNKNNPETMEREIISTLELSQILFNSRPLNNTIYNRMEYDYNHPTDYLKHRDRINYNNTLKNLSEKFTEFFNDKDLMNKSLDSQFYKVLYSHNNETHQAIKDFNNENITNKKIYDPLYFSGDYKAKEYHTTLGALIMYRRHYKYREKKSPNYVFEYGKIPDLYFEIKPQFYKELKEYITNFINSLRELESELSLLTKEQISSKEIIYDLDSFESYITHFFLLVEESIKYQLSGEIMPKALKNQILKIINPNMKTQKWEGWFSNFYKPRYNLSKEFNHFSYSLKVKFSHPRPGFQAFKGNVLYASIKNYSYGIISALSEGKSKVYAFSRFDVEENNVDFHKILLSYEREAIFR